MLARRWSVLFAVCACASLSAQQFPPGFVDPAPLPPHGAIPELNLTDWHQLKALSHRERELDDDNWIGAAKGSRDQVALQLSVNDGDRAAIRFAYAQERGERSGLRIEIRTR